MQPRGQDDQFAVEAAPVVVVVDDDELSRELIVRFLRKMGLANNVVTALDGDHAVSVLAEQRDVSLVLLDLEMPGRSGIAVLEWLQSRPEASPPVVMLTGSAELPDIDRAYQLGIEAYLVKPVGFGALSDVIRGLQLPWRLLSRSPSSA